MPADDFNQKSPVVEAHPGDNVETIASELKSREKAERPVVLLLHVDAGQTSPAIKWLDAFAAHWGGIMRHEEPWGSLTAMPLIIVDADKEDPDGRQEFISWGVSSFTDGRSTEEVESQLEATIRQAGDLGAFADPRVEQGAAEESVHAEAESGLPPYAEALRVLAALSQDRERED